MAGFLGRRNTLLPAKSSNTYVNGRSSDYGEPFFAPILLANHTSAWEGSLFVARATPAVGGTGVALGIQTSFSDTANVAVVLSNGEAAGGKRYLPLFLRGRVTAAGTTTTSAEIAVQVDATNRYSSGGTALTANCVNPDNTTVSSATVNVGAVTCAAAGAQRRYVGSALVKVAAAPLWLVNDVILLTFGGTPVFVHQSQAVDADAAAPVTTAHIPMAACAVPAGGSMTVHLANVANATTPPSVEWELAWVER